MILFSPKDLAKEKLSTIEKVEKYPDQKKGSWLKFRDS